jgi:hypothetical protein
MERNRHPAEVAPGNPGVWLWLVGGPCRVPRRQGLGLGRWGRWQRGRGCALGGSGSFATGLFVTTPGDSLDYQAGAGGALSVDGQDTYLRKTGVNSIQAGGGKGATAGVPGNGGSPAFLAATQTFGRAGRKGGPNGPVNIYRPPAPMELFAFDRGFGGEAMIGEIGGPGFLVWTWFG